MYIIKKQVAGIFYYWNDVSNWWEGLYSNATQLTWNRCDKLMSEHLKRHDAGDYSFTKI